MPEVFDSNRYDAMLELTESATMQDRDIRKTVSHLRRQERLDPESTMIKPEGRSLAINPTLNE